MLKRMTSGIGAVALVASCGVSSGPEDAPLCTDDSPATGGVVINEFMTANALSLFDEDENSFDWVELYNTTGSDISLCGWRLTMSLDDVEGTEIIHESTVPAGGHVVLFLNLDEPPGASRIQLALPDEGGELGLIAPDGTFSDRLIYGEQAVDFSAARQVDGGETWAIAWHISPGEPNSDDPAVDHQESPSAPPEMVPAAGDLSEILLGYDQIPAIGLEIDEAGIEALRQFPRQYVPGSIIYEGRTYGPVGVRLKGVNSFQPIDAKPSFRINVDEYAKRAEFFGKANLTFNNMDDDPSMMHERLAYRVAREMGPASRANHVMLTLNGELYGLYTQVEAIKRRLVARWFDDDSGSLYEATDVDFREELIETFEHESGTDDRSVLFNAAAALENPDADAAIAAASEFIDIESFWQYWALCAIVAQYDAFPYSLPGDDFFIYIDPATGKITFLPWGMDETFLSAEFPITMINSVLAERCLDSPACYQGLVDRVWDALDLMEAIDLARERNRVEAQIASLVSMDKRKPYDDATIAEYQLQLRYFIEGRRQHLSMQLPPRSSQ